MNGKGHLLYLIRYKGDCAGITKHGDPEAYQDCTNCPLDGGAHGCIAVDFKLSVIKNINNRYEIAKSMYIKYYGEDDDLFEALL